MQWYYSVNGERRGPVGQAELEKLVTDGVVKAETLVWQQGMGDWQPYAKVAGGSATPGAQTAGAADDGTEVCAASGKRYPRREMINFEGKWISAEHRDAYFQRQREGVSQPDQFVYGDFWPRFGAKVIDTIIGAIMGAVINVALGIALLGNANYFRGLADAAGTSRALQYQVLSNVLSIGLGVVYVWFFLSRYSATPGKMALGLKVVRSDGSPLTTGRIIGRYFAEILSSLTLTIGYIIAAFDPERRALHDRICDTRVIKSQ